MTGSGSLVKAGAGTLTLYGSSTYSGGTTLSVGTLTLGNALSLGIGSLTINGGTLNAASGAVTLANTADIWTTSFSFAGPAGTILNLGTAAVTMTNSATITASAGNLIVNTPITATGGAYRLTKAGAGTLTLGATNTFTGTGGVLLNAGQLNINSAGALGTTTFYVTGASTIDNASGAPLTLSVAQSWGAFTLTFAGTAGTAWNLTFTGPVVLTGAATVTVSSATATLTEAGSISGGFNLTKGGPGTLVLGNTDTYSGTTTTINGGTLQIGTGGTSGSITSTTITSNATATLAFNRSDTYTFGVVVSAGSVMQMGTGTLVFNVSETYTAPTIIAAGTLQVGSGTAAGALPTATTYTVVDNGTLAYNNASTVSLTDNIAGTGGLTKFSTYNLTLTPGQLNTFSGITRVNSGTLTLGSTGALWMSTFDSGPAGGTGTLSFGALAAPMLGGLQGTNNLNIVSTATTPLTLSVGYNGANTTFYGNLTGTGSLIKVGTGWLALTGTNNTYSGGTTVSQGTLKLAPSAPANPMVYYSFDAYAGTEACNLGTGGTAYWGTLVNGAFVANGGLGGSNALGCVGNAPTTQYLRLNNYFSGNTGTYTISAWFYGLNSNNGGANYRTLFRSYSNVDRLLALSPTNDDLGFCSVSTAGFVDSGYSLSSLVGQAAWHQIAVVANGVSSTFYVDGSAVGSVPAVSTYTYGLYYINNYTTGEGFAQKIDDVYLYQGSALSAQQIAALYGAHGAVLPTAGTMVVGSSGTLTISSILADNGTATSLEMNTSGSLSGGVVVLSNTNTYSGGTILTAGELSIASTSYLGTGPLTFNGGILQVTSSELDQLGHLRGQLAHFQRWFRCQ